MESTYDKSVDVIIGGKGRGSTTHPDLTSETPILSVRVISVLNCALELSVKRKVWIEGSLTKEGFLFYHIH